MPLAKGSIFANLVSELKLLVQTNTFVNIFKCVLSGRNLFYIMRGFLHTLSRVPPEDEVQEANHSKYSEGHFLKELYRVSCNSYPKPF